MIDLLSGAYGRAILSGLAVTVLLAVGGWLVAFVSGLLLAVARMTEVRAGCILIAAWIEYQRNVPVLVHIFTWYFGVSQLLPIAAQDWVNAHSAELLFASLAIGLYYGAYVAEDVRSGFRAISDGQFEASRAVGLSYVKAMRYVIVPQALRAALPALISRAVLLLKSTSLAMVIGAMELTYQTREIDHQTFRTFDAFLVATIIYLALSGLVIGCGGLLTRRLSRQAS